MHPTFKHVPPNVARFSTHVTFIPSCAALMAPTYPPGPPPIITTSCCSPVVPDDEYDLLADENDDKLREEGIEFEFEFVVIVVPNNHRDAELVVVIVLVNIIFALLLIIPLMISFYNLFLLPSSSSFVSKTKRNDNSLKNKVNEGGFKRVRVRVFC
jgi:hypothetical protein